MTQAKGAPPIIYAIDASVAIKWFSEKDEDYLEQALKLQELHLQGDCLLIAPDLLVYEVVNALQHNPNFEQTDTVLAFQSLRKMELSLIEPGEKETERAIELAYEKNITIYDASYLALAQERRAFLITADMKFYQKVGDLPHIITLRDLLA